MDKNNPFFSGSKPNLISDKVIKKLDKILQHDNNRVTVTGHLSNIYENYIKPNLFAILVFIIVVAFLIIRYMVKKYKEENGEDLNSELDETETIDTDDKNEITNGNENGDEHDDISLDNITENNDDIANANTNDNNGINFYTLKDQYEKMMEQNNGMLSEQFIKDAYARNSDKLAFDEMAKIIVQGGL